MFLQRFYIYYVNYAARHPLYLCIRELDGFINEENRDKYLNISLISGNNAEVKILHFNRTIPHIVVFINNII